MKKDFSLTFIQVVCAIAVVTLHTNGCFWNFSATERYWITANIIECICYYAIPVFFMITGITLLDYPKRYSTGIYFKKRVEKTVLPYIIWSFIGIGFKLAIGKINWETISCKWIVNGLLSTDKIVDYYWFFQPLFCVYLCIPLFAYIEKKKDVVDYIVLVGFIVNVLVPFLNNVLHLGLTWPYSVSVISGYLFWVWMGYKLYFYPPTKKQKIMIYIFALIGLLLHIVGTHVLSVKMGTIQSLYKGYVNLPCVLYSLGVFVFLRDVATWIQKSKKIEMIIETLGKYTFPLYLIHWFILCIRDDVVSIDTKSMIYRLFAPYIIFMLVICFTWILRKIPGVRKIVP